MTSETTGETLGVSARARMDVVAAQDAIAALIPEIEKLAWQFFQIARALDAPEVDEDFDEAEPGPEHLRYHTANGAMSAYLEHLALIPFIRKAAEQNAADLLEEWQRKREAAPLGRERLPRVDPELWRILKDFALKSAAIEQLPKEEQAAAGEELKQLLRKFVETAAAPDLMTAMPE